MQSKTPEIIRIDDYNIFLTYLSKKDVYYDAVANGYKHRLEWYWHNLYDK